MDDIVTRYRVDVSQLQKDANDLVDTYAKMDKAATDSATKTTDAFKSSSTQVERMTEQIARLQVALAKASNPDDITRLNKAIAQQSAALMKVEAATKQVNAANTKQLGLLEQMRTRLHALNDARETSTDTTRITRLNSLIEKQEKHIAGLITTTKKQIPAANAAGAAIEAMGRKLIAAFAIQQLITKAIQAVDEFAKSAERIDALNFSVTKLGTEGVTAISRLDEAAKKLSKTTVFSKDEIINSQVMLSQFGLTSDQINQLLPGITDLAAALQTDLGSATETAISAITGTTRGLKRINGDFEDLKNPVKNYNELMRVLGNVQGAANAQLDTTSGQLKQLANEANNQQQAVGEKLSRAWVKVKNAIVGATEALIDFFTTPQAEKEIQLQGVRASTIGILGADDKATSAQLIKEREQLEARRKVVARLGDEANERLRTQRIPSRKDSDDLVAYKKEFDELKAKIDAYNDVIKERQEQEYVASVLSQKEQKILSDLTGMNIDQLNEYIKGLRERHDVHQIVVQGAIGDAQQQIEKLKQLNEKEISDRKQALEQLRQANETFNAQKLQAYTKNEMDALEITRQVETAKLQLQFKRAGGRFDSSGKAVGDIEAVKLYNSATESLNELTEEKKAEYKIKKANEVSEILKKISDDNLKFDLDATLANIDNAAQQQVNAISRAYVERGDISKEAETKLQSEIFAIQMDAEQKKINERIAFDTGYYERQRNEVAINLQKQIDIETDAYNKRGDFSEAAEQRLSERVVELRMDAALKTAIIDNDETKSKEKNASDQLKIEQRKNDEELRGARLTAEQKIELNQMVFDKSVELINTLFELESTIHNARIENMEAERDLLMQKYDDEQNELQTRFDKKIITEAAYEKQSDIIRKKRIESEKQIQAKINEEKRKADAAKRTQSLFEIYLNTAVAAMQTAKQLGFPAAIPFIALVTALGAAQAGIVLSTPLPKYAKGTKYVRRNNGEPVGTDTIPALLDEGERVVPRKQNIKYWKVYNSMDDGTFDSYVNEKYILPRLMSLKQKSIKNRDADISTNIAKSMLATLSTSGGNDAQWYEFMRLWRNGITVKNIHELKSEQPFQSIYQR